MAKQSRREHFDDLKRKRMSSDPDVRKIPINQRTKKFCAKNLNKRSLSKKLSTCVLMSLIANFFNHLAPHLNTDSLDEVKTNFIGD